MSKDRIRKHYEHRARPDVPGFQASDWADSESQLARFVTLTRHVPLAAKCVLDVGCGLGDLLSYLRQEDIACDYLGVDLVESMILEARRRHPGATFLPLDVFDPATTLPRPADIVFASGIFNLDVGNNRTFLPGALERLWRLASDCLVFNLLHTRTPDPSAYCVYWDPTDILDMLHPFTGEAELIEGYLPNDFTVICRK